MSDHESPDGTSHPPTGCPPDRLADHSSDRPTDELVSEVARAVGPTWEVVAVATDLCGRLTPAQFATYILKRSDTGDTRDTPETRADPITGCLSRATRWAALMHTDLHDGAADADLAGRIREATRRPVVAASLPALVQVLAIQTWVWPGTGDVVPAHVAYRLHQAPLVACRAALSVPGPDGDLVRNLVENGQIPTSDHYDGGVSLSRRLDAYLIHESLHTHTGPLTSAVTSLVRTHLERRRSPTNRRTLTDDEVASLAGGYRRRLLADLPPDDAFAGIFHGTRVGPCGSDGLIPWSDIAPYVHAWLAANQT